ncbi:RrF2 family transcriptional regulator [Aequorivita viscosa]|uniref:Transcriptional regulator, BadM/Rrf2 family n=1 Tax=Aequorivita viscosa TaxID=797419 RepID=A0A1M6GVF7_9FLAO|nr:Rrf2 family transcriptional regulator [Aequorivita viscosa]SDW79059.1 transcriptional regulator, BadM/Rrf2 family [Aequorivita viscosa]SHJ13941.1 transcriptional regulator, BadM/Rrf2 family [Aequorivita viscosa]
MFSKACQYGIKASVYIASQSAIGIRTSLKDIAFNINSPEAFTAKILHQLAKQNILESLKGPTGGFEIPKGSAESIKLAHIVSAIDGDSIYNGCALGFDNCDARQPCPMHDKFVDIRDNLKEMLENTSLLELANGVDVGLSFLKR